MPSYPDNIKIFLQVEDGVDKIIAQRTNDEGDEINAIEAELGTNVKGSAADLKTRLAIAINDDGTLKKKFVIGTYQGSVGDQDIAHGLVGTPTWIRISRADASGMAPKEWFNGLGTSMIAYNGLIDANEFSAVPDGTNIKLKASAFVNQNGVTYYFVAMVA